MFFPQVKQTPKIRHLIESPAIASMRVWVWMLCIQVKATGVHWLASLAELVSSGFNERPGLKKQGTGQLKRRTLDVDLWPLQAHMHAHMSTYIHTCMSTHAQAHMHKHVRTNN